MTPPADVGPGGALVAERVLSRIHLLGRLLRARGVEVSLSELLDANRAAEAMGLGSRHLLRVALRSTLVKQARHLDAFDHAFDLAFPHLAAPTLRPAGGDVPDRADVAHRLAAAGDLAELAELAADLVDGYGGLDGERRGERHHVQRVYRGADLARLMSEARKADPTVATAEVRRRIDELKRLIAADVRSQLDQPHSEIIDPALQDLDFLRASRAELDQLREAVRPLARRLAARFARRRHRRASGRVNMRRTLRRSLGSGGVPLDVVADRPRIHRPELFVLCDISGSMADVSLFTLTLMSALSAELAQTRSFVFVDAVDEVTSLLADTGHGIEPWQILRNSRVIGHDGHSDYGSALRQFWDEVGERDLRPTSTVLITGDARTNHRPTEAALLARMARRCRRIYWLNPEPRDEWDSEDSEMTAYAQHCTDTFEVRNLRQLMACVEDVL